MTDKKAKPILKARAKARARSTLSRKTKKPAFTLTKGQRKVKAHGKGPVVRTPNMPSSFTLTGSVVPVNGRGRSAPKRKSASKATSVKAKPAKVKATKTSGLITIKARRADDYGGSYQWFNKRGKLTKNQLDAIFFNARDRVKARETRDALSVRYPQYIFRLEAIN